MMTSSGILHCRRLLLLVPSHAGHLEPTRVLLGSLLLRVVDLHRASLRLIVGDDAEKALFELQLRLAGTSIARSRLDVAVVTLAQVLHPFGVAYPPFQPAAAAKHALLREDDRGWKGANASSNKFLFQFTKKLYAARFFSGYEHAIVLDAEASILQPNTSLGDLVVAGSRPLLFASHDTLTEVRKLRRQTASCLSLLGMALPLGSGYGPQSHYAWGYFGWLWRRPVVEALFARVEAVHGVPLLETATRTFLRGRCFEASLYWLFDLASREAPFVSPARLHQHQQQQRLLLQNPQQPQQQPQHEPQPQLQQQPQLSPPQYALHHSELPPLVQEEAQLLSRIRPVLAVQRAVHLQQPRVGETGFQPGTYGHHGSHYVAYRVASVETLGRFLNGTCAYVPVGMRSLEFFTGLLMVPQPKSALRGLASFVAHFRVAFVRPLEVSHIHKSSYRSSIGWPGYNSHEAKASTYLSQLACLILASSTLRVAASEAWSAADAQTFALEAENHSVLYNLCSAAPRAPPPSERVAHGLRSYTPSTTPVLCARDGTREQSHNHRQLW